MTLVSRRNHFAQKWLEGPGIAYMWNLEVELLRRVETDRRGWVGMDGMDGRLRVRILSGTMRLNE